MTEATPSKVKRVWSMNEVGTYLKLSQKQLAWLYNNGFAKATKSSSYKGDYLKLRISNKEMLKLKTMIDLIRENQEESPQLTSYEELTELMAAK